MTMMNMMSVFFFVLSLITLLFGVLGRLAERPVLGLRRGRSSTSPVPVFCFRSRQNCCSDRGGKGDP